MQKQQLVTNYSFVKNCYQNVHSAGPNVFFYNPCIGYVKKGYVRFLYKGKTVYAHEGDLIYIAYGTKYHSIWFGTPDVEWYSINFSFKSPYDFCEYPFQILKNYPPELFEKMYKAYENSYMLSVSHFYQLLDDIYNKLETEPKPPSYNAIEPAIEYIESHYTQNITISTLAEICHCSESGIFKMFRKATGVTPITYKHNIMIQQALELLSHTNLSIEEISNRTGFASSNYFRTVFFKLTGKTPKELR